MPKFALILLFIGQSAFASVDYQFNFRALSGPLAGQESTGSFSITPQTSTLFGGLVIGAGTFDSFDFIWGETRYTNPQWGWTMFDDGEVVDIVMGTSCAAGYCGFHPWENSWIAYGHDEGHYSYEGEHGTASTSIWTTLVNAVGSIGGGGGGQCRRR